MFGGASSPVFPPVQPRFPAAVVHHSALVLLGRFLFFLFFFFSSSGRRGRRPPFPPSHMPENITNRRLVSPTSAELQRPLPAKGGTASRSFYKILLIWAKDYEAQKCD